MEIKRPTPQGIDTKIFEEFEPFASPENGSQVANEINNRTALKQKINDVEVWARNNDASGINDLLEKNQTITEQKSLPVQVGPDNFQTTKSTNESSAQVEPSALSLLDRNLLAARFTGPMIKKLTNNKEDK
ncbi:MAG TPA: hypothetical protein VH815_13155 [Acidobacteriota bacterium]